MKHDDNKSTSSMENHHHQQQQPSFTLKPTDDGVQVEMRVPDEPWTLLRPWKKIDPLPSSSLSLSSSSKVLSMTDALSTNTSMAPVMATSSSSALVGSTSTTTRTTNTTDDDDDDSTMANGTRKAPIKYITETIKIECRPCETTGPEQGARALIMGPNPLSIVACTNRLAVHDREEMSQVLVHELVHAYDVKRLRLDFSDCESMAYSEVRAAREAECFSSSSSSSSSSTSSNMMLSGPFNLLREYCVKQQAIAATHNLFPAPRGRNCVRAVFATAFNDPRPFSPDEVRQFVQRNQIPTNSTSSNNKNNYPSRSHK
jgi:Peptidase M76 family